MNNVRTECIDIINLIPERSLPAILSMLKNMDDALDMEYCIGLSDRAELDPDFNEIVSSEEIHAHIKAMHDGL